MCNYGIAHCSVGEGSKYKSFTSVLTPVGEGTIMLMLLVLGVGSFLLSQINITKEDFMKAFSL